MARQYSSKYPPKIGDCVGYYDDTGRLYEAFVVNDIVFGKTILRVENLTLSQTRRTYPNGALSFISSKETGLKLISRGGIEDAAT